MERLNIVSGDDFKKMLQKNGGAVNPSDKAILVRNCVDIHGFNDSLTSLHIEGVVFQEPVTIVGFKDAEKSVDFTDCEFFHHLRMRDCVGKCISLHSCKTQEISLRNCKYESAFLRDVEVLGKLNLAGLTLDKKKGCFIIHGITYNDMSLIDSPDPSKKNRWPIIDTDDEALILQLCALGIPVVINTALAKKMTAKGLSPILTCPSES